MVFKYVAPSLRDLWRDLRAQQAVQRSGRGGEGRGVRHSLVAPPPCVPKDVVYVRCFGKVGSTALKCLKNDWCKRMKRGWNIPDEELSIAWWGICEDSHWQPATVRG